MQLQL
jgi:hypothetical protein